MEKDTIIEFGSHKYLLLDGVKHNGYEYFTAESLNLDGSSKGIYGILKIHYVGDQVSIDTIRDQKEMIEVVDLMIDQTIKDVKKLFFETGSVVEVADQKWVVMDYIPYKENVFVILLTAEKPAELLIAKVVSDIRNNEMKIIDVSGTEEAIAVLKIHSAIYNN